MDEDFKKIKKIVSFMKKEGVLSLKLKDFDLSVSPSFLNHHQNKKSKKESLNEKIEEEKQYSDEEILMWSSPGYLPPEKTQ